MQVSRSFLGAAMIAVLVAASIPSIEAAPRRGAAPRAGAPSARQAPAAARSNPARTAAPARTPSGAPGVARGRATYGYGHSGGTYPPYWWDGYWGWGGYWGAGSYWGWPYWGWPYTAPAVVVPGGAAQAGLPELPAVLETAVSPKSATVRLDGEEIGKARDWNGAWDALTLPPGVHVLEFSKDGYRTFRAVVELEPGMRFRVERDLAEGEGLDPASDPLPEPAPVVTSAREPSPAPLARGFLHLRVRPSDAAVYLDGRFLASGFELDRLHGAIPVAAGTHRVEVMRPGHRSHVMEVEVAPSGDAATVEVTLEPEP